MFDIDSLSESGFSWQRALSMASASKIAYQGQSVIENVLLNSWGYETVLFFDSNETQCFVAESASHTLLAFRGTQSLGDWLGNLDVLLNEREYGTVHNGFFRAFQDLVDFRVAVLNALKREKPIWLTGHSLGGALASIAVAEWNEVRDIQGVYTYGQPRVGDQAFQHTITSVQGGSFFRFVNNDDIVTRIPPGYLHVGRLIHFDANGSVQNAPTESEASTTEFQPLSEKEFEQVQKEIIDVFQSLKTHKDPSEIESALDVSVEGFIPGVRDHKIDGYIANIRRQIREDVHEPRTRMWAARVSSTRFPEAAELVISPDTSDTNIKPRGDVPVLLRLKNENWDAPQRMRIGSRFGTFATAIVSRSELEDLKSDPDVVSIELSRDAGVEELDGSVPFVKADVVHRPPIEERGDQALVGIIDTGVDVLHEAFQDDTGACRILAVWHQRDNTGPSPHDVDPQKFSQGYGTLYLAPEIATFIGNPATTPSALRDPKAHGTHVACIAAGRRIGNVLGDGMAPAAGIVVVIPHSRTPPGEPPSIGYSISHVDALHFLKAVASGTNPVSQPNLPMSVNVSLGMNAGAHDGTSTLEEAFDSITGGGRDAGLVIVKSAGNERGHGGHARVRTSNGRISNLEWDSTGFRFQDYIEIWYSAYDELRFMLIDPAGNRTSAVDKTNSDIQESLGGNACRLQLSTFHRDNGDNLLKIAILQQSDAIQSGRWVLEIEGVNLGSGEGYVDAWVERDQARAVQFVPDDPNITLSIPGTADTVISVGACNSAIPFSLTRNSSFGLTRDNRAKPDIVAPGTEIIAARANTDDHRATVAQTGTSMAAPHVTGALALVMSGRRKAGLNQLNANQLRKALNAAAQERNPFHNEESGWGILDAEALYRQLVS